MHLCGQIQNIKPTNKQFFDEKFDEIYYETITTCEAKYYLSVLRHIHTVL